MSSVSQARSLGKYFLLFDNLIVVLGFFVVFPLISIRFVEQLGWAAVIVGFALGMRQLVQQGLGIFGGAIADRFGARPMIVTGMLLRALGFALMAGLFLMSICMFPIGWVSQLHLIFGLLSLFYLGMVTADPAREMLSASLTDPRARGSYMGFSRLGLAFGGTLGYTGGGWLYDTGRNLNIPQLPWILLGLAGLITIYALHRQFNQKKIEPIMINRH
ncbi:MFS transporter [Xenorhabdus littoralis]|uniref:MFS transporter n=1 Tax=Xenorhabdus littoralis TaxID=2582835 RepID=UPI0029E7F584|nr:MFS transporter [Xenorhabdus sp. psl]MDX7990917.1 MFS transporter [Xenorhabdus sp. psl]